jgi:hypothetical protein
MHLNCIQQDLINLETIAIITSIKIQCNVLSPQIILKNTTYHTKGDM